jgi:hypothetical protein
MILLKGMSKFLLSYFLPAGEIFFSPFQSIVHIWNDSQVVAQPDFSSTVISSFT